MNEGTQQDYSPLTAEIEKINAKKSRVTLEKDGSDHSPLQVESNARMNVEVQDKLQAHYEVVQSVIQLLRTAESRESSHFEDKDELVDAVTEAAGSLAVIEGTEPELADKYMDQIIEALTKNENLKPWKDEILYAARNKLDRAEKEGS